MSAPNPIISILSVRKPRTRQVRPKKAHMDNAQLEKFLRAAKDHGPREHAMFLFAFAHGARASEICNLRISDVNFRTEQVRILRLKGSLDTTQALLRIKGSALFGELATFKAWLAVRKADANDFVFNSQKSCRLNRVTVFKLFRAIATAAGLPEALRHPHVLKHTCAMRMVHSGAGAFHIKQHLGHRSFDSTLEYIDVSDVDASAAFAKACSTGF
jgi:integrase